MSILSDEDFTERYESLYARDFQGRLVRMEDATRGDLERPVTVWIDGTPVEVPLAFPAIDDQGIVRRDENGLAIPRRTTIADAAAALSPPGTVPPGEQEEFPKGWIPVLCHQEHVTPVAVCRVCSVLISKDGKASRRLVPACQHPVIAGMQVHTIGSREEVTFPDGEVPLVAGEYVRGAVRKLVELLAADHLHAGQPANDRKYHNELQALAERFGLLRLTNSGEGRLGIATHFARKRYDPSRRDETSPVILVDHNHCILCDRCVRACSEVKPFRVIGHTGFGHRARISFDLDRPMAESHCVSCGECAVSCPTGALTFKGTVYQDRDPWEDHDPQPETVPAEVLETLPLFSGIPYAFLKWNEGSVGRLECPPGHVLCREGEFGATAFVIERGAIAVEVAPGQDDPIVRTPADVIVGEMACMNLQARNATLRARGASTVLVVRRNMLHVLRRNRNARKILDGRYRDRALETWLRRGPLFEGLDAEQSRRCVELLEKKPDQEKDSGQVTFLQVDPGEIIVREGQPADCFFILYSGRVEVSEASGPGRKRVRDYLGPGRHFGEIGLMSALSGRVAEALPPGVRGLRTGTCIALDHVELVRISEAAFRALLDADETLSRKLEDTCLKLIAKNAATRKAVGHQLGEFTRQGLHQGQHLLVLDLEKCTSCQECVRACSDSHDGVSRLILEGERFDKYLVPSACRSCHDPVCLIGCPVDAIHRRPTDPRHPERSLAIVIEDHCIGCGLCAHNCPFGSIHMFEPSAKDRKRKAWAKAAKVVATNCDLCEGKDLKGVPRCVYACPHDAAHRQTGFDLARLVGLDPLGGVKDNPGAQC